MRRCSDCHIEKENGEFAFENKAAGTLQRRCRQCHAKRTHDNYVKNKTKIISNLRQRKQFLANLVAEKKKECGCILCDESEPVALDYHHIGVKSSTISEMIRARATVEAIELEIEKCVVLCANCHRKLHAGLISL